MKVSVHQQSSKHIAHRIKSVIHYLGITPNQFAKQMGYDRSDVVYNVINFKNYPSYEFLYRVIRSVENLNSSWLITGDGDMLSLDIQDLSNDFVYDKLPVSFPIPVYDVRASAETDLSFFIEGKEAVEYLQLGEGFQGCEAAVRIYGDAMHPMYQSGDLVVLKRVKDMNYLQWGHLYLVVTETNCLLKYVRQADRPDKMVLESHNEDYAPFEVDRKTLLELYEVRGLVRRTTM